jgi:hypothetical protein
MPIKMTRQELKDHVNATYVTLRYGISLLGFLLPIVLLVGGWAVGVSWQESISHYYHTTLRDVFVGSLCGIGAFLYLYKGFSREENIALNISGIALVCVGLFPTPIDEANLSPLRSQIGLTVEAGEPVALVELPAVADSSKLGGRVSNGGRDGLGKRDVPGELGGNGGRDERDAPGRSLGKRFRSELIHIISALVFFFSIAYVCIRCAGDTLHLVEEPRRSQLASRYWYLGRLMIVVPSVAALLDLFDLGDRYHVIFMVEWAAILVFSGYWWTKSREFKDLLNVPEVVMCQPSDVGATKSL